MTPVWWILGFIPALVALYFLKLKRQDVVISSTMLWKRSLEDLHVNSPFQRLRRSLLFLLQLLILTLLITAVWRPRCNVTETSGRHLLVLVDNSASMNAREKDGTRFELARREALDLVESMVSGDRMMVLSFAARATTVQPLTSDRALLASKVRSIEPTALPTDLGRALATVASIAEAFPSAEVYVLSDGCHGELSDIPPEAKRLNIRYISKGTARDNAGIVEADVRRTFGRDPRTEVFVLLASSSETERELTLSLFHEDRLVDARPLVLPAGESLPVTFDVTGIAPGLVRAEIDGEDALPEDDRIHLEIAPPKEIRVIVTGEEENRWLEWALASNPQLAARRVSTFTFRSEELQEELHGPEPPVVIYDRWVPPEVPPTPALFLACYPPLPETMPEPEEEETPRIFDWDRTHPVNRFLVYTSVQMQESLTFRSGGSGYFRPLVEADKGAVIGVLTRETEDGGTVPALIVGFDILESNWPLGHHSFPLFFTNALDWLGSRWNDAPARWRTGEPVAHVVALESEPEDAPRLEMRSPSGERRPVVVEKGGTVVLGSPEETGVYELLVDSEPARRFGVGLLDARESDLRPKEELDFGAFTVEARAGVGVEGSDLWTWFALAALAIMLLEWYVYHRRVYV